MTALSWHRSDPRLEAFDELSEGAVLKWVLDDGCAGIRAVLEGAISAGYEKREAMRSAALSWARKRSWSTIADATRIVYEEALAGGVE
jgi:hypothetical protein